MGVTKIINEELLRCQQKVFTFLNSRQLQGQVLPFQARSIRRAGGGVTFCRSKHLSFLTCEKVNYNNSWPQPPTPHLTFFQTTVKNEVKIRT